MWAGNSSFIFSSTVPLSDKLSELSFIVRFLSAFTRSFFNSQVSFDKRNLNFFCRILSGGRYNESPVGLQYFGPAKSRAQEPCHPFWSRQQLILPPGPKQEFLLLSHGYNDSAFWEPVVHYFNICLFKDFLFEIENPVRKP